MTKQTISQISGIQNEEYDKVTIAPGANGFESTPSFPDIHVLPWCVSASGPVSIAAVCPIPQSHTVRPYHRETETWD